MEEWRCQERGREKGRPQLWDRHGRRAITLVTGGIQVSVQVTLKAAANRIGRISQDNGGIVALKVAVTAIPEDGKANAAVVRLLARAWKLPQCSLSIVAGGNDRRKILLIAGEPFALARHLQEWIMSQYS